MGESIQHKLDRVRPPRVQITYDVEIGNAVEMKELPFVVGILADLSGMPAEPLPKMKERKFVEIDRDNFNSIMTSINPRLTLRVDDKIAGEGQMSAELFFKIIEDFEPLNVVKQIPVLTKLYESRTLLKDLLTKLDGNDVLEGLLQELIDDEEKRNSVKGELESLLASQESEAAEGDNSEPAS